MIIYTVAATVTSHNFMLDGISQELLVNAVQIDLKSYLYIKRSTEGEHAWEYRRIMQARIRSMM